MKMHQPVDELPETPPPLPMWSTLIGENLEEKKKINKRLSAIKNTQLPWLLGSGEQISCVPESLGLVMDGAAEAPWLPVVHLGHHPRVPALVGVGRELHRDGLRAARGRVPVQVLDGVLRLRPLVEADEGHASWHSWKPKNRWETPGLMAAGPHDGKDKDELPEAWSTSTLELMMCPKRENMSSRSCWLSARGRPLMYRLASLIMSELGRANETYSEGEEGRNRKPLSLGPKQAGVRKFSNWRKYTVTTIFFPFVFK